MVPPKFEEINTGDEIISFIKEPFNRKMIREYGYTSGDVNPIHMDDWSAWRTGLNGVIAHGLFFAAYIQQAITDWADSSDAIKNIEIKFIGSCRPGDFIMNKLIVTGKNEIERTLDLELKQYAYTPLIFGQIMLKDEKIDDETLKKNLLNAKLNFNLNYGFEDGNIKEINKEINFEVNGVSKVNFISIEEGAVKIWVNLNEKLVVELNRKKKEKKAEFIIKRERQSIAGTATVKLS